MRVIDPGHHYTLSYIDNPGSFFGEIEFVKRDNPPEKYPGNSGHHAGTNLQEVMRVLIDRTDYLRKQAQQLGDLESVDDDIEVMYHMREALLCLERRAARRHGRALELTLEERGAIETCPTCPICGHIKPETHEHS